MAECICKALSSKAPQPNQTTAWHVVNKDLLGITYVVGWCVVSRQHTQHCFWVWGCESHLCLRHKLPTLRLSLPRLPEDCFSGTWESIGHGVVKEVRSPQCPWTTTVPAVLMEHNTSHKWKYLRSWNKVGCRNEFEKKHKQPVPQVTGASKFWLLASF